MIKQILHWYILSERKIRVPMLHQSRPPDTSPMRYCSQWAAPHKRTERFWSLSVPWPSLDFSQWGRSLLCDCSTCNPTEKQCDNVTDHLEDLLNCLTHTFNVLNGELLGLSRGQNHLSIYPTKIQKIIEKAKRFLDYFSLNTLLEKNLSLIHIWRCRRRG